MADDVIECPPDDSPCEDCGGPPWRVSLLAAPGRLWLCAACAADALAARNARRGAGARAWAGLLGRARAAAAGTTRAGGPSPP